MASSRESGIELPEGVVADQLVVATPEALEKFALEKERIRQHILLVLGTAGVGKSTMIEYLAEMTDMKVIKLDNKVEEDSGYTMEEMWDRTKGRGEPFFRLMEEAAFAKAVQPEFKGTIIDAGGGLTDGKENFIKIIDTPYLISGLLTASVPEIVRRLRSDPSTHRPWLPSNEHPEEQVEVIQERVTRRDARLRAATSFVINTEGKTPRQVASAYRQNALRVMDRKAASMQ